MKTLLAAALASLPLLGTCAPGAHSAHRPPPRLSARAFRPAPPLPVRRPAPRPPLAYGHVRPAPPPPFGFGFGLGLASRFVWVPGRWETVFVRLPDGRTVSQTVWVEGRYIQAW